MAEVQRIALLLKEGYDGRPWYGTALRKLLADVTAERAAVRPFAGAHSIWQEALHAIAWRKVACRLLRGETVGKLTDEENWPEPPAGDAVAWQQTLAEMAQTQQELEAALERLTDDRLDEKAPGTSFSFYVLLHGIIHHDAYHAGQIAMLRNQSR
jgi:uncharacterized damage-inducible protein DinB